MSMSARKRNILLIPIFILLVLPKTGNTQIQIFNEDMYKFGKALHYITSYYIDSVNRSDLVEQAVEEMISDLDPHTTYLTKEEVKAMNDPPAGQF